MKNLFRLFVLLLLTATAAMADDLKPVRVLSNWFAQPDQAGYWLAQQDNLGKQAGLAISVTQGGPKIQTIPQVAAGQAEFGIANADDVLIARYRGAPIRAVFAHMNYVPYDLVYHANPAVKSLTDLNGRTFAVAIGISYWEWLKKQYHLEGRAIPVTGDLSLFRNDPNMVQQGYSLYLPARMAAAGIDVGQFKVADLGYRPYAVLFTTDDLIKKDPALVKAAVATFQKAWADYAANPASVKSLITTMNKQISPEVYDSASKELIDTLLPADRSKIGCMTAARWHELADQLRAVNFLPASFDETQAYDTSFVPGCAK